MLVVYGFLVKNLIWTDETGYNSILVSHGKMARRKQTGSVQLFELKNIWAKHWRTERHVVARSVKMMNV